MEDIEKGRVYYMPYIHDLINTNRIEQGLKELSPWTTRKRVRDFVADNPGIFMPTGNWYSRQYKILWEDLIKVLPHIL